ncbi:Agamous-like MADS-box protein AGL82 [Camellia lanceoleosa]|uniref:Agamous-like MADS-box protein AGL82 n=1 Tax=Camellia lanceoleosa TaxID=1840588 RepID=A0ACC0II15_9ERIC|nr:Agamous-like MADS-box protein AGL82 [Camellia lanceoleosa]
MELIRNEKARYVTYQKRKKGLKKKTCEPETLCDVQVCLIIYGPKLDGHSTEVEIWPQNPNDIQCLINSYRNQSIEHHHRRTLHLSTFLRIETKRLKMFLSNYGQLRAFEGMLEGKLANVKARVEFIKGTRALASLNDIEQTTQQNHSNYFMQDFPMMTPMNNINDDTHYTQLGGVSCTESSFSMSRMIENVVGKNHHPSLFMGYGGGLSMQTMSSYMQYLKMASGPSQVHAWQMKEYYKANEFQMKNQK